MKKHKKNLEPITLVLLVDFHGHPSMAVGEEMNTLRFQELKRLVFDSSADVIIIDNTLPQDVNEEFFEIKRLVDIENIIPWIVIDPDDKKIDIPYIVKMIEQRGRYIQHVVVGGCNTAGCVIYTKPYAATKWAKDGYDTSVWLPICAEYQMVGATVSQTNMKAFEIMFNYIKDSRAIDNLRIIADYSHLPITRKNV